MKGSLVLVLLVAPILASGQLPSMAADCSEIKYSPSGIYPIFPAGAKSEVMVKCDMDTDRGGWTVMSSRFDGSVNFYRPWNHYKVGFGKPDSEHWIGLDNLHYMTSSKKYELRVVMEDFDGNTVFANYGSFSIGDECSGFQLNVGGFSDGGAGDALRFHNKVQFTTLDRDNDFAVGYNCARKTMGPFWHTKCYFTSPNGLYRWVADDALQGRGITWYQWKNTYHYSMKKFIMMIRPVQ